MAEKKERQAKTYTKGQILQSKKYPQKDVLNALLNEEKEYTQDEILKLVNEFLIREVK